MHLTIRWCIQGRPVLGIRTNITTCTRRAQKKRLTQKGKYNYIYIYGTTHRHFESAVHLTFYRIRTRAGNTFFFILSLLSLVLSLFELNNLRDVSSKCSEIYLMNKDATDKKASLAYTILHEILEISKRAKQSRS